MRKGLIEDVHTSWTAHWCEGASAVFVQRGQAGSTGSASRQLPGPASANGTFALE